MKTPVVAEFYSAVSALVSAKAKLQLLIRTKEGIEKEDTRMAEIDNYLKEIIPVDLRIEVYMATAKRSNHDTVMNMQLEGFYNMSKDSLGSYLHWLENAPNKASVTRKERLRSKVKI